jgi:hypothetical protein
MPDFLMDLIQLSIPMALLASKGIYRSGKKRKENTQLTRHIKCFQIFF